MDIPAWTGTQLLFVIIAYWVVFGAGWFAYTRRPGLAKRQEAARAASVPEVRRDSHGRVSLTYSMTVDYTWAIILIVAPPALLVLAWLMGSRV
jgi:hypothetical protein